MKMQKEDLQEIWKQVFPCQMCSLPKGYAPQFRPVGPKYNKGGVVFVQINPGHIGSMSALEIAKKYKTKKNKETALLKVQSTIALVHSQREFACSPTFQNWEMMNDLYLDAIEKIWGWPPGKYRKTIERHGVKLEMVAVVNLAQCPVPEDKYGKKQLENCWECFTQKYIDLLEPSLLIAQGHQVFNFLEPKYQGSAQIIKGFHHASRLSNVEKEKSLSRVAAILKPVAQQWLRGDRE